MKRLTSVSSYRFGASVRGSDGKPLGFAARRVMNTRAQQNTVLPDVKRVVKYTRPRKPTAVTLASPRGKGWASWLGKAIGQGQYGVAFRCVVSSDVYTRLEMARASSTYYVESKGVRQGQTVVVKLAKAPGAADQTVLDNWALSNIKEATWHKYLDDKACVALGPSRTCVSQYVPTFYWAGMVNDAASKQRIYVTVMGLAPGYSVSRHLERTRNTLSPQTYLQIERALASMWINGIVHADSHVGNLMYEPATNRVTVIDFGFGALLTQDMVVKVRRAIYVALQKGVLSLGEIWRRSSVSAVGTDVQNYVDRIMAGRGFSWYNPDGHVLMRLASLVPREQRAFIPSLRQRLWGSGAVEPARAARAARAAGAAGAVAVAKSSRRTPRRTPTTPARPRTPAVMARPAVLQRLVARRTPATPARRRRWFPRIRFPSLWWTKVRTPILRYDTPPPLSSKSAKSATPVTSPKSSPKSATSPKSSPKRV